MENEKTMDKALKNRINSIVNLPIEAIFRGSCVGFIAGVFLYIYLITTNNKNDLAPFVLTSAFIVAAIWKVVLKALDNQELIESVLRDGVGVRSNVVSAIKMVPLLSLVTGVTLGVVAALLGAFRGSLSITVVVQIVGAFAVAWKAWGVITIYKRVVGGELEINELLRVKIAASLSPENSDAL